MVQLLGEFDCKLDAKGRLMVPSNLKKQLPDVEAEGLVINRGFEKHLVLYPKKVWESMVEEMSKLNQYEPKTREFIRYFTRGATALTLDAAGRVNLPKSLLESVGIEISDDLVLACQFDKIEVWSKKAYEALFDSEPENFAFLAQEVMEIKTGGKMENNYHVPVLLKECMDGLNIKPDGVYVDVTFGGGGHAREILKNLGKDGVLIAFDQDPDAQINKIDDPRFHFVDQNFAFLKNNLRLLGFKAVDGILADLGVSSHQFNEPERGFSTRFEAALDMRMDKQGKLTAADILNTYTEDQLHKIFGIYGEVKNAKSLARAIVTGRADRPVLTLADFKAVAAAHIPKGKEHKYMAQVFQALRIEVNAEMKVLEDFLLQTADVLKSGGRLVVMSYHSLEDRPVKNFIAKGKFRGEVDKDFFGNEQKPFKAITRKAIVADELELQQNSRSRSAKLRVGERI